MVRIHVIMGQLDDAAPDWVMGPATTAALKASFAEQHPQLMAHLLDHLRFVEQYDPVAPTPLKAQPYVFVCDLVHEVDLSVRVDDVRGKGVPQDRWDAMTELRDQLSPGVELGWYIVVCGDTERPSPGASTTADAAASARSSVNDNNYQAEPSANEVGRICLLSSHVLTFSRPKTANGAFHSPSYLPEQTRYAARRGTSLAILICGRKY
jgi:hypothetical protein